MRPMILMERFICACSIQEMAYEPGFEAPGDFLMMRAGSVQVVITPPVGAALSGYFTPRKSIGVHDDLFVRALVLEQEGTFLALVSCDLKSIKAATVTEARALVQEECGIPAENIMISCSHTHTGPYTTRTFTGRPDPDYLRMLPRYIAGAVTAAYYQREDAAVGIGIGQVEGIAFNRRYRMKDGIVRTNPGIGNPEIGETVGPVDPALGVIKVARPDGSLLAAWGNYTVHADVIGGHLISADFPGFLSEAIQRQYGSRVVVLYTNGACGDINHINVNGSPTQSGFEHSAWMGRMLAAEMMKVLEITPTETTGKLRAVKERIELPLREITPLQVEEAMAHCSQDESTEGKNQLYNGSQGRSLSVESIFARGVLELVEERKTEPLVSAEIQALQVGKAAIVTNPSELFVEYGLEIKRKSPFQPTFVAGYTNGMIGYVPTRQALIEGGYETRLARSSKLAPEAGEAILEASERVLAALHS